MPLEWEVEEEGRTFRKRTLGQYMRGDPNLHGQHDHPRTGATGIIEIHLERGLKHQRREWSVD
jgi:hypothetical protein